jgi:hypothetical protein
MDGDEEPDIIECEIRLHSGRPATPTGEPTWSHWMETVVGVPVTFQAIAKTGQGQWNGPLSPGVEIPAPIALTDPYWTVFLPVGRGVPIAAGQVGRPLAVGECFHLSPGTPGVWTSVVFDGAIVID